MGEFAATEICFSCNRAFAFGGGQYRGTYIPYYKVAACESCYSSNWDGWSPDAEEKLVKHLANKSIALPQRNSKGWLPRNPSVESDKS